MSSAGPTRQSASFSAGPSGSSFRIVSEPLHGDAIGTVIWAHAFAEEMNKTRRMCARLARLLAGRGWRVVQRDLLGCGDSQGELREATWEGWTDELVAEVFQADAARPAWLWGVRAGALFAPALVAARSDLNLLLWQPALNGSLVLQQFLRLHTGARVLGAADRAQPTPAQRLKQGEVVEVGGYELTAKLTAGLDRARLAVPAGYAGRVVWIEVSPTQPPMLSPLARDTAAQWRERGVPVQQDVVHGPSFWQTQEIEDCDDLLDRSLAGVAEEVLA